MIQRASEGIQRDSERLRGFSMDDRQRMSRSDFHGIRRHPADDLKDDRQRMSRSKAA